MVMIMIPFSGASHKVSIFGIIFKLLHVKVKTVESPNSHQASSWTPHQFTSNSFVLFFFFQKPESIILVISFCPLTFEKLAN